jgi:hypothetical protein
MRNNGDGNLKEKLIKDFFKIIAFKIVSRHVRGKTKRGFRRIYKVFIEYEPYVSNSSGIKGKIFLHVIILFFLIFIFFIKGYVCSCKSGLKIAGTCVHVASLLYYLSYARHQFLSNGNINLKFLYLNKILVDMDNLEPSNNPKLVRSKRTRKLSSSSEDTDAEPPVPPTQINLF